MFKRFHPLLDEILHCPFDAVIPLCYLHPLMAQYSGITFSFYGLGISIKCPDSQTLQDIRRDYSFFLDDTVTPKIFFEIFDEAPDYSKLPPLKATIYSPRNICYTKDNLSFIDYFGKGLTIIDRNTNIYKIFCIDSHLRHEIVFLSILSLVGQDLDSRHLHRVHGLGLEIHNKAILILLPSGGGKTTLLLELMKHDFIKLISEDSPLIDASGNALPFPIRIGMTMAGKPSDIPEEHLHLIQRMEFGSKYVIDVTFFKDKIIKKSVNVQYILCGVRCLGTESSITPLSKRAALKDLVTNSVVGVGLYQGLEFLLQNNAWELLKKGGLLFSRLRNVSKILSGSRTYSFVLGCDRAKNVETFLDFCRKTL